MTNKEFKLLLVLRGAFVEMNALQLKRAGRYWFLPWQIMADMASKGWVSSTRGLSSSEGVPAPMYYQITGEGSRQLGNEIARRARA